jgi:zinc/manganese transport system permease protein
MILPAAAARFWTQRVETMCLLAIVIGALSSISGLLLSYHAALPSGPAIILSAGCVYAASVVAAPRGIVLSRLPRLSHRTA